jgi:hypothetical protein
MAIKRMDNVLIVVDDLEAVKTFFIELGLKLEGESTVEGPSVGSLIGLKDVRATLAMLRTPDGQGIVSLPRLVDSLVFGSPSFSRGVWGAEPPSSKVLRKRVAGRDLRVMSGRLGAALKLRRTQVSEG